jgi:hypothetical protein
MAGWDWFSIFLKGNRRVLLRTLKEVIKGEGEGVNRKAVKEFFDLIKEIIRAELEFKKILRNFRAGWNWTFDEQLQCTIVVQRGIN